MSVGNESLTEFARFWDNESSLNKEKTFKFRVVFANRKGRSDCAAERIVVVAIYKTVLDLDEVGQTTETVSH